MSYQVVQTQDEVFGKDRYFAYASGQCAEHGARGQPPAPHNQPCREAEHDDNDSHVAKRQPYRGSLACGRRQSGIKMPIN